MSTNTETDHPEPVGGTERAFTAETAQLLRLVVNSLYSTPDVVLRELISNAFDACDKRRLTSLASGEHTALSPAVSVEADKTRRTLTIIDNGIGLTHDEAIASLGSIAKSGTREFVDALKQQESADDRVELIGRFGVGFYSAFMIADHVTVLTRSASETDAPGIVWTSDGTGGYQVREATDVEMKLLTEPGARVTLHMREDAPERLLSEDGLRDIIQRYCDHGATPVSLAYGGKEATQVTSGQALWRRRKSEVTDDDYKAFYHALAKSDSDPFGWSHVAVEGTLTYSMLLYLNPDAREMNFMDGAPGIQLYAQRTWVTTLREKFLPQSLQFVSGIVESPDLSLSAAREAPQETAVFEKLKQVAIKRSIQMLVNLAKDDSEAYEKCFKVHGRSIQVALSEMPEHMPELMGLQRYRTTKGECRSLDQCAEQSEVVITPDQPESDAKRPIYWISDSQAVTGSAVMALAEEKGWEVIVADAPSEFSLLIAGNYNGRQLCNLTSVDPAEFTTTPNVIVAPDDTASQDESTFLEAIASALDEQVSKVVSGPSSQHLPGWLRKPDNMPSEQLRKLLAHQGTDDMAEPVPELVIDVSHPLVSRLKTMDHGSDEFQQGSRLLLDVLRVASGAPVMDVSAFGERVTALVTT